MTAQQPAGTREVPCKGCEVSITTTKRFNPRGAGGYGGFWCKECVEAGKDWPQQVLVAREKHGTRIFNALTRKDCYASALRLLMERFTDSYWYHKPDAPSGKPELTKDQIDALPDGEIKNLAKKQWKRFKKSNSYYEDALAQYNEIVLAVESEDGRLAFQCLRDRDDHEYEGICLEILEGGEIK
ncbi:MAG: hypothetical protein ACXABY_27600 [Candidatus Thorarchaeota archaeon]|jgi:hypothetical protein